MPIDVNAVVNAAYTKELTAALAADAVLDAAAIAKLKADSAAALAKALADDAAADAAVLKAKDDEITKLKADLAACREGNPVDPPPPPPPPPPPTGSFIYKGLQTVWPTAATTGPRVALTAATSNNVSGVVTGKRFNGMVTPASGTVLQDCEITTTGNSFGVDAEGKTNVTVQNCRLIGNGSRYQGVFGNCKVIACDISGYEDGVRPFGAGWLVKGCYIHDLTVSSDAHNDGVQTFDGPGVIEENRIMARDTSCVMVQSFTHTTGDAPGGVIVRHNYLGGASGYPLRIEVQCKGKGCQAYENVIERGAFGFADITGADVLYGNLDAAGGAAILGTRP